jgi:phage tail protein X
MPLGRSTSRDRAAAAAGRVAGWHGCLVDEPARGTRPAVHREDHVEGLARSIRLVTGLGMIAAGSSLVAPAGIEMAAWWQAGAGVVSARPMPPVVGQQEAMPVMVETPGAPAGEVAGAWAADRPRQAPVVRHEYVPPPPPAPLPAAPAGHMTVGPDLTAHYRTTLTVPPPPLLDGQRPPPLAVGWAARGASANAAFERPPAPAAAAGYRVRDGDDLTAIAIRFYGTPAAAAVIWQTNRGILRDPGLLPIGAVLTLPPPDAIGTGPGRGQRRSIEPPASPPAVSQPGRPAATASWLNRD